MRKTPPAADGVAPAPLTWGRKKRADTVEKTMSAENPEIRHADAAREARDLGSVPRDREEDRRVSKDAEVVRIMGVLPDVLSRKHQILPECLLHSRMEFIAPARTQRSRG